jgi:hypothetical protein
VPFSVAVVRVISVGSRVLVITSKVLKYIASV